MVKRFAAMKERLRSAKPKKSKMKPQVHRSEETFRCSEAILHHDEGNIDQKKTFGLTTTKDDRLD